MIRPKPELIELDVGKLEALLDRVKVVLDGEDWRLLKAVIETLVWLTAELETKKTSLRRLRNFLFAAKKTEKTSNVLAKEGQDSVEPPSGTAADKGGEKPEKKKRKGGNGRNGADAYTNAEKIEVRNESLTPGCPCPNCEKGKVYHRNDPRTVVRVKGQAPLAATIYEFETLRCNLCGDSFSPPPPEDIGEEKYAESAKAMIALLKYGSGMPFYRQEKLQGNLGVPLPASTQWGIVEEVAQLVGVAYEELIRQAAQGDVFHNDDTAMKILEHMKENELFAQTGSKERTGMFTSGIVAIWQMHRIAVFFTGRKHAGENLAAVLKHRASELDPPIQMCDGASRNVSNEFDTILANCLGHGRRKFVEVIDCFPEECRYVLEILGQVYKHDSLAKAQEMSPQDRLVFHQAHSGERMEDLHRWMVEQFEEKKSEPNSPLGGAISYMLKRWDKLTLFLRKAGAPLDNNICERVLKKIILHRKNALFYKTLNGARVGDIFMSLIKTAELEGANPFDYLTELLKHHEELRRNPHEWMPWNYQASIAGLAEGRSPPSRAAAA